MDRLNKFFDFLDREIKPTGYFYTLKQFFAFYLSVFIAVFVITGIEGVLAILGVFSDSDKFLPNIAAIHIETSFIATMIVAIGRFSSVRPSKVLAKKALQKREPRLEIQRVYILSIVQIELYTIILVNVYYALTGGFVLLEGGKYLLLFQ